VLRLRQEFRGLPSDKEINYKVENLLVTSNRIFYVSSKLLIESIAWRQLNIQFNTCFREVEGKILKVLRTNHASKVWFLCQIDSKIYLKLLKVNMEKGINQVVRKLELRDEALAAKMQQNSKPGFIEASETCETQLFLYQNAVFSIDSLLND